MTTDLTVIEHPQAQLSVYGNDDPEAITRRVVAIAGPLADFIKRQHMSTNIQGREYVLAEGWAFMGSMLGVFPNATRVSEVRDPEGALLGFEAHVELRTRDGAVVGGAIAECSCAERNWSDRDPFALKSMAQTRATGKAYRMAFGFVMKAAGYEATPAEEMAVAIEQPARQAQSRPPRPDPRAKPAWAVQLDEAMREAHLTQDQLSAFLGTEATYEVVQAWMTTNKGSAYDLVALAVPDKEPADLPF
jgi:hypothetical protein